jgi:hypothetical protein
MRLEKQIKIWKYLAWTLPFTALATVSVLYYFEWEGFLQKFFLTILVGSITISTFWWWWVMDKILATTKKIQKSEQGFLTAKKLLQEIKKDIP